jgi:hypothetical protein
MRMIRNVSFLFLLAAFAAASPAPARGADCNWDGVCDPEEEQIYYMCGDCGNSYCTNQCDDLYTQYYCEDMCYGSGLVYDSSFCDSMSGHQDCDFECYCVPMN